MGGAAMAWEGWVVVLPVSQADVVRIGDMRERVGLVLVEWCREMFLPVSSTSSNGAVARRLTRKRGSCPSQHFLSAATLALVLTFGRSSLAEVCVTLSAAEQAFDTLLISLISHLAIQTTTHLSPLPYPPPVKQHNPHRVAPPHHGDPPSHSRARNLHLPLRLPTHFNSKKMHALHTSPTMPFFFLQTRATGIQAAPHDRLCISTYQPRAGYARTTQKRRYARNEHKRCTSTIMAARRALGTERLATEQECRCGE